MVNGCWKIVPLLINKEIKTRARRYDFTTIFVTFRGKCEHQHMEWTEIKEYSYLTFWQHGQKSPQNVTLWCSTFENIKITDYEHKNHFFSETFIALLFVIVNTQKFPNHPTMGKHYPFFCHLRAKCSGGVNVVTSYVIKLGKKAI